MKIFGMLLVAVLFVGCGGVVEEDSPPQALQWPELKALDELSAGAEVVLELNDEAKLQAIAGEMKKAAITLAEAPLPDGVKNAEELKPMLAAMIDLAATLDDTEHLKDAVQAFHPVVEKMMETAGVPHTHDHDHSGHDHGHEGHDHSGHNH